MKIRSGIEYRVNAPDRNVVTTTLWFFGANSRLTRTHNPVAACNPKPFFLSTRKRAASDEASSKLLRAMAKTGLLGPYTLTFDGIASAVARTSPGVYALGHTAADGTFRVHHIGRSDVDVSEKLRRYIGSDTTFKYGYLPSSKAAFEKECELYHDFRPPGNALHPDRPQGSSYECPRCRFFGSDRARSR
jgi:hypothetical protein